MNVKIDMVIVPFKTLEMLKSEIENNYDRVNPDFKGFDFERILLPSK